jgi:hypothetical protein
MKNPYVSIKKVSPFPRLVPEKEKACLGRDLAKVLAKSGLSVDEAKAWNRDLQRARDTLEAPPDKW